MNESCSLRRANSTSVTRSGSAAAACAAANLCALDWEAIGTKELLKRVGCRKAFGCKTGVAQLCFRQRKSNCLCPRAPHTCNTQARKQRVLENEPAACSEVRIIIITISDQQQQRNKIWKCLCYAAKAMEAKHFFSSGHRPLRGGLDKEDACGSACWPPLAMRARMIGVRRLLRCFPFKAAQP